MLSAFVAFMDEVGPREGEALSMTMGSVEFDGTDVTCKLWGKTGKRQIYLVKSVSMLSRWLDLHPLKEQPDAALWLNLSNRRRHEPWNCRACECALESLARKAALQRGIDEFIGEKLRG